MRHILRRRELVADDWRYLGEPAGEGDPLIVALAQLKGDLLQWQRHMGPLGARLSPADQVEELVPLLPRLALVALEFPNPGDGRGYSQARLLRGRLGFRGELRAVGAGVRQDQAFLLTRCGFDSLEPAPGVDHAAMRRALGRYNVAYQPGAPQLELRRQRFSPRQPSLSPPPSPPPDGSPFG